MLSSLFSHPIQYLFGTHVPRKEMIHLIKKYNMGHDLHLLLSPVGIPRSLTGADMDLVYARAYSNGSDGTKTVIVSGTRKDIYGNENTDSFNFDIRADDLRFQ